MPPRWLKDASLSTPGPIGQSVPPGALDDQAVRRVRGASGWRAHVELTPDEPTRYHANSHPPKELPACREWAQAFRPTTRESWRPFTPPWSDRVSSRWSF